MGAEDINSHPSHQPASLDIDLTAEVGDVERSVDTGISPNTVHIAEDLQGQEVSSEATSHANENTDKHIPV